MSKVFVDVGISLDGFMAGENRGPSNPMGGVSGILHEWMFEQAFFRERLRLPAKGKDGPDNKRVEAVFARTGAYILGKNMFEEGVESWPDDGPFNAPAFVLTHTPRKPWRRKGENVFYFETGGIEKALRLARESADGKDIRIGGGANTIRQFLDAGMVDEMHIHLAPVFLEKGLRLFENTALPSRFKPTYAIASEKVTHLGWEVSH